MLSADPLNFASRISLAVMDTSNVDTVFVSGKAMKRNGELLHVYWNAVKKTVTESRGYVMKKSGFKLPPI